jgi:SWI/SNF-related matrix-associated actin-dependent regulator 1 of chromatin subfamily A
VKPTKLTCVEDLFILEVDYQNRHIASTAGFSWSKQAKKWFTDSPEAALMLKEYAADEEVKARLAQIEAEVDKAIGESRSTFSNANIPVPEGKSYLPFQKAGIEYMTNRKNVLLGDEMGCLSGDSLVFVNMGGKEFVIQIKKLYERFNNYSNSHKWSPDIPTYATSLIDGELRLNRIKAVKYSGIKDVIKVTTESGKSLKLTPDHEVLLSNGTWLEAGLLGVGDSVQVNGQYKNEIKNEDRLENLTLSTRSKNDKIHSKRRHINALVPQNEAITAIEAAGLDETYDIVMSEPGRNFVANGIIVHNCGKTIELIGLINNDPEINRILIICPASLRINWRKEAESWLVRPLTIGLCDTKKDFPETNLVIVNYDILNRFEKDLRKKEWDLLAVDECHYLKNPKTRRTQQVTGKKRPRHPDEWELEPIPAKRRVFMSGTPMVNRPIELWPLISTLDPKTWHNYAGFAHRYCNAHMGRFGWDTSGAANLGELQRKLRETILLRRTKNDVLTELPPKIRQIVPLPMNGARAVIERENRAFAAHEAALQELRIAAELAKAESQDDYTAAVERLRDGAAIAFGELSVARKETAIAKVPYVLEHLQNAGEHKVVIFAHHREVIRLMWEALGDRAVVLTGETSMKNRNEAVRAFQEDAGVKYFIGSIQAAGVGLTLTASSHVVFAELDWVPGVVNQSEDRCHRLGQKDSVLVQHLVFDGSVDARMAKTLVSKQAIFDAAMNDPDVQIPTVPEEEPPATSNTSWKQVDSESKVIKTQTVAAIHSGLRYLSNICDGAKKEDGMGFNAYDSAIGKNLAAQTSLSNKQAVLGRKILMKYKKQIGKELMDLIVD